MSESGASQPRPDKHAAAPAATGSPVELRPVWFNLMPYVPAGTDRRALAQRLADHLNTLTRASTGETYPVAAEVFVVAKILELQAPGKESPCLLVHGWAERPWQRDGEWRHVVTDFFDAVTAWFLEEYPVPVIQHPAFMPVVGKISERFVRISEFAAHTSGELPPGWAELIAWHGPLLPMGPLA
ncbi:hypothetical protein [Streptomyces mirabilis]|uniref:hypothetical protein n=1 Tax=Streptomyces mirabilis TaxID=68239 RepID=UPI00167EE40D|nr:hypothetical protein [Streptomyces mirabilis]GHD49056.1 hypothetical protein GCM10010317_027330 [Streptomyces mirabilis]